MSDRLWWRTHDRHFISRTSPSAHITVLTLLANPDFKPRIENSLSATFDFDAMQLNIHIGVPTLGTTLLVLFAVMGIYHYRPQEQHTPTRYNPTRYNATHEDILYQAHKTAITALEDELTTIVDHAGQFNAFDNKLLFSLDMIQRLQTAEGHIEQLQKATACEGTGPWKTEAFALAARQQRVMSLCEWLGTSGTVIHANIGNAQALSRIELFLDQQLLGLRKDILEMEEILSMRGLLGEGEFLRGRVVRR